MKVTKEKAAENREALVRTAARLFRERGIDGVGVAEISEQAGLTHGALYAQFPSKQALAAEALAYGVARGYAKLTAARDGQPLSLSDCLDFYLSTAQRDNLAMGCPMAASASEIARQDEAISARFTEGVTLLAGLVEAALFRTVDQALRHDRALAIVAAMIGGLAVARGTAKANPKLSDDIVAALRGVLGGLGGERRVRRRAGRAARAAAGARRSAVGPKTAEARR